MAIETMNDEIIENRDKGISTIKSSYFNKDGKEHQTISAAEAEDIFNFTISKEQSYRANGTKIPGQFHLVRRDPGIENDVGIPVGFTGVGREFDVTVQPMHALQFITKEIMPEVPDLSIETVATLNNGATSFVNFKFGDNWDIPGDDSEHETRLLYMNPFTKGASKLLSHSVRIVCMNTLKMAEDTGTGFRIAHTANSRYYTQAALESIKTEICQANELKEKSFKLADCKITSKNIKTILDKLYPLKNENKEAGRMFNLRAKIMEQFENDKSFKEQNAWSFLNAITFVNCHPNLTKLRTGEKTEFSLIGGDILNRNAHAMDLVWNETALAA